MGISEKKGKTQKEKNKRRKKKKNEMKRKKEEKWIKLRKAGISEKKWERKTKNEEERKNEKKLKLTNKNGKLRKNIVYKMQKNEGKLLKQEKKEKIQVWGGGGKSSGPMGVRYYKAVPAYLQWKVVSR